MHQLRRKTWPSRYDVKREDEGYEVLNEVKANAESRLKQEGQYERYRGSYNAYRGEQI